MDNDNAQEIQGFIKELGIESEVSTRGDQYVIEAGLAELHALGATTDAYLLSPEAGAEEFLQSGTLTGEASGGRVDTTPVLVMPEWRMDELREARDNSELMDEMKDSISKQMIARDAELDILYKNDAELQNTGPVNTPDF